MAKVKLCPNTASVMDWWDVIVDKYVIIWTTCTGDLGSSNEYYLVLPRLFDLHCWISIRATTKASLHPGAVYSVSSWFLRSKCEMKGSSPATSYTLVLKNEIPQSISFCSILECSLSVSVYSKVSAGYWHLIRRPEGLLPWRYDFPLQDSTLFHTCDTSIF